MARTPSKMIPLGSAAPSFSLPDTLSGETVSLESVRSPVATVVLFICNHCPFVKHVQQEFVRLFDDYNPRGVNFVAISSNDVSAYPQDGPEKMREEGTRAGYNFPYLYDESQEVARAYGAACTPDIFVYDRDLKLVYRGQLDDSRPENGIPVTGEDLRRALDCVLTGMSVPDRQVPSIGCNIKWRA